MQNEQFRPVFGYEGRYEVSEFGTVVSLPTARRPWAIVLKQHAHKSGHLVVNLSAGGVVEKNYVHRLVAFAFHGVPAEGEEVRHLDGSPANNRSVNLAWGTHTENQNDRLQHGTDSRGEKHGRAKLTSIDVETIRLSLSYGASKAGLARRFSVSESAIRAIANGSNWKHV